MDELRILVHQLYEVLEQVFGVVWGAGFPGLFTEERFHDQLLGQNLSKLLWSWNIVNQFCSRVKPGCYRSGQCHDSRD